MAFFPNASSHVHAIFRTAFGVRSQTPHELRCEPFIVDPATRPTIHISNMLKLRAILSFAIALVGVAAQLPEGATSAGLSYSASGDGSGAGDQPIVTEAPTTEPTTAPTRTPAATKKATTTSSSSGSGSAGDTIEAPYFAGEVPCWGKCDRSSICAPGSTCKALASGISLCYPVYDYM